jgi:hypothetical protein
MSSNSTHRRRNATLSKARAKNESLQLDFISLMEWTSVPDVTTGGLKLIPNKPAAPVAELTTRQFAQCFLPAGKRAQLRDLKRVSSWIEQGIILEDERRKLGPRQWLIAARAASRLREEWKCSEGI